MSAVEVRSAPVVEYRVYPQTVYEGRVVYLVDNRWGYPQGDRWVVYRTEPPALARYRTTIESAPPAPRAYVPATPEATPAAPRDTTRPTTSAPPAHRTR